jgi:ferredoxin-NADP reductase
MSSAYISAIAALAGSGIGAVASLATTWLTQDAQARARRVAQAVARREHLYGEFIEEASKLFTDALTHQFDDPSKFVRLYALVGRLRLFAPANVIAGAEEVMQHIVKTYHLPNRDFSNPEDRQQDEVDVLRAFSETCREDLGIEDLGI